MFVGWMTMDLSTLHPNLYMKVRSCLVLLRDLFQFLCFPPEWRLYELLSRKISIPVIGEVHSPYAFLWTARTEKSGCARSFLVWARCTRTPQHVLVYTPVRAGIPVRGSSNSVKARNRIRRHACFHRVHFEDSSRRRTIISDRKEFWRSHGVESTWRVEYYSKVFYWSESWSLEWSARHDWDGTPWFFVWACPKDQFTSPGTDARWSLPFSVSCAGISFFTLTESVVVAS